MSQENNSTNSNNHDDPNLVSHEPHYSTLYEACASGASFEVISKMIDDGGKELVMETDPSNGRTALHCVCLRNKEGYFNDDDISYKNFWAFRAVRKLLEVGGKELVMVQDTSSLSSALHYEVANSEASIAVVAELLYVGGKDLVLTRHTDGSTALHHLACYIHPPYIIHKEIFDMIVSVSGIDSLFEKDNEGYNVLHRSIANHSNIDFITQLIKMGGRELASSQVDDEEDDNPCEENPLHVACANMYERGWSAENKLDVINLLIEEGGADVVKSTNFWGLYPMHSCISSYGNLLRREEGSQINDFGADSSHNDSFEVLKNLHREVFSMLLQKGIEHDFKMGKRGWACHGGLFASSFINGPCSLLFDYWHNFVGPILQNDTVHSYPLILHWAIKYRAPNRAQSKKMYEDIIERFPGCITERDHDDHLPLEVAIRDKFDYNAKEQEQRLEMIEVILQATANAQGRSVLNVAAQYKLKWHEKGAQYKLIWHEKGTRRCPPLRPKNNEYFRYKRSPNGFEKLLETNQALQCVKDVKTGLYPYMLAASGDGYDLGTIFELMRRSPQLVTVFDNEVEIIENHDGMDDEDSGERQRKKQRSE